MRGRDRISASFHCRSSSACSCTGCRSASGTGSTRSSSLCCATCCSRSTGSARSRTSGRANCVTGGSASISTCCRSRAGRRGSGALTSSAQHSGRFRIPGSRLFRRRRSGVVYHRDLIGIPDVTRDRLLSRVRHGLEPASRWCAKGAGGMFLLCCSRRIHRIRRTTRGGVFSGASESAQASTTLRGTALGCRSCWALAALTAFCDVINIAGDVAVEVIALFVVIVLVRAAKAGKGRSNGISHQLIGLADSNAGDQ